MNLRLKRGSIVMGGTRAQWDNEAILGNARTLQYLGDAGKTRELLIGKHVALLSKPGGSGDADLFFQAARGLGAQVAQIRAELFWPDFPSRGEILQLASLLGRLYAAVECQGRFRFMVPMIEEAACIPVYDHIASSDHPTAKLVALLEGDALPDEKRRLVLQAVLLGTIL